MPKPEGLLYKDIVGEVKEVKDDGTLVAAISTNGVDRMGEVLEPSGVDLKNYKNNPVVLWAHDYSLPPIAKAQWVKRDGDKILSKLKFAPTPFAQEVKMLYEQGFMKTFSVGFIPKEWVDGDGDKKPRRTYTGWELLEYSAVPVPANPEALALAMEKGLCKTPEMQSIMNKFIQPLQEFNNEVQDDTIAPDIKDVKEVEVQEELVNSKSNEKEERYEDLISENAQLKEQICGLEKEVSDLKYNLYVSLKKNQLSLSEMTAGVVAKEVGDEVRRVIRKAQGKID